MFWNKLLQYRELRQRMPRPHGGVEERHAGHQSNKQIGCEAAVGQTGKGASFPNLWTFSSLHLNQKLSLAKCPQKSSFSKLFPCNSFNSGTCIKFFPQYCQKVMKFPTVRLEWMSNWKWINGLNRPHWPVWTVWPVFPFLVRHPLHPHCTLSRLIQQPPLSWASSSTWPPTLPPPRVTSPATSTAWSRRPIWDSPTATCPSLSRQVQCCQLYSSTRFVILLWIGKGLQNYPKNKKSHIYFHIGTHITLTTSHRTRRGSRKQVLFWLPIKIPAEYVCF